MSFQPWSATATGVANPWSPATLAALGVKSYNYPPWFTSNLGAALQAAGVVYLVQVPLTGQQVTVTNVLLNVGVAGGTLTAGQCFAGLYDNNGNLIGTSADQSTPWGSQGFKTAALTGGPFTGNWPFVYVGVVFNGTTGPGFLRPYNGTGAPGVNALNASGTGLPAATVSSGQTSLPSSVSYAGASGVTSVPQVFWCGLS